MRSAKLIWLRWAHSNRKLTALHARELLEGMMVHFLHPSAVSVLLAGGFGHLQATGRPVVHIAAWVNRSEDLDHPP